MLTTPYAQITNRKRESAHSRQVPEQMTIGYPAADLTSGRTPQHSAWIMHLPGYVGPEFVLALRVQLGRIEEAGLMKPGS